MSSVNYYLWENQCNLFKEIEETVAVEKQKRGYPLSYKLHPDKDREEMKEMGEYVASVLEQKRYPMDLHGNYFLATQFVHIIRECAPLGSFKPTGMFSNIYERIHQVEVVKLELATLAVKNIKMRKRKFTLIDPKYTAYS